MFIGHLGLGLAAKGAAPQVSLGALLLACQWLDVVCGVLMVTSVERMRVHPGITVMTPLEFVSYPWSHGLAMSVVWSALGAGLAGWVYREWRAALVVGGLVFSHWVLDWISHAPDLPLLFAGSPKVGLGLWNSAVGTMGAELGLFVLGGATVLGVTRARDRVGGWALASLLVFFPALFLLNHFGPPPPEELPQQLLALPILVFVLLLPWGHWIERHREARRVAPVAALPDPAGPTSTVTPRGPR